MSEKNREEAKINEIKRYGSYLVRFSPLSDKWCVYEGIVLVNQKDEFHDAVVIAKGMSGYSEPESDLFMPIPAVMTDLTKLTLSPGITAGIADLSGGAPSMDFSSPDMDSGGTSSGGGGGGGGGFSGPSINDIGGGDMGGDDIGGIEAEPMSTPDIPEPSSPEPEASPEPEPSDAI